MDNQTKLTILALQLDVPIISTSGIYEECDKLEDEQKELFDLVNRFRQNNIEDIELKKILYEFTKRGNKKHERIDLFLQSSLDIIRKYINNLNQS